MWQERMYPELTLVASEVERKAAYKAARKQVEYSWSMWVVVAVVFVLVGLVGVPIAHSRIVNALPVPHWLSSAVVLTVSVLTCIWGVETAFRRPVRRALRSELNRRGYAVCERCGYNLTGLTEPRCPECGQPFEPKGDAT